MKYCFNILAVLCLLSSCRETLQVPAGIMPVNRMKVIVWDVEIADQQASDRFLLQKDSLRMEATSLYQQVFAKHKISKSVFYKSFAFYQSNPELLKTLFDSVTAYGNRQKTNFFHKKADDTLNKNPA